MQESELSFAKCEKESDVSERCRTTTRHAKPFGRPVRARRRLTQGSLRTAYVELRAPLHVCIIVSSWLVSGYLNKLSE